VATMEREEPRGIEAKPIRSYDFPHPINETISLEDGVGDCTLVFGAFEHPILADLISSKTHPQDG
jgi:hypothetical protein